MKICPICLQQRESLDGHHPYPIGYGGPFKQTLFYLCAGCHQDVHKQAEAYARNDKRLLMPMANIQRAELPEHGKLITTIIRAKSNYENGIIPHGGSKKNHDVIFSLTREQLIDLHRAKNLLGATSLQALMEAVTMKIVKEALGYTPESFGGRSPIQDDPRIISPKRANGQS